jgi:hypothetical protein
VAQFFLVTLNGLTLAGDRVARWLAARSSSSRRRPAQKEVRGG